MAVREWFAGQEILLTGVTSDIGNAVLEKLLRSCLGIKTIHVVVRSWNSLRKEQRVKRILSSVGFERVRQDCPDAIESRLNIVEGNLLYDNLGLRKDQLLLLKNVNVVIHAGGPHEALLDFCSELPALRAVAAVVSIFKERGKITEYIEKDELPSIPLALVRVPAIGPALKEPMPGYLSVLKGATALMVGAGYALGDANLPAAILPVDLAANTLLASAWSKGSSKERTVTVYNVPALDCTWKTLFESGHRASKKFPYPSFGIRGMTSNPRLHSFIVLLLEWLPSFLCDTFLHAVGSKPRMLEEHYHIRSILHSIEPVLSKTWLSDRNSVRKLHDQLTPEDQEEFYVRSDIDLEVYVLCSAAAVKKLCIRDDNAKLIIWFKLFLLTSLITFLIFSIFFC